MKKSRKCINCNLIQRKPKNGARYYSKIIRRTEYILGVLYTEYVEGKIKAWMSSVTETVNNPFKEMTIGNWTRIPLDSVLTLDMP